ncbi:MAG: hypothetical protein JF615_16745, partial [Asticcacaulis sp.]|nr:hypothetical protein [Asticcacaulis sp.]
MPSSTGNVVASTPLPDAFLAGSPGASVWAIPPFHTAAPSKVNDMGVKAVGTRCPLVSTTS